MSFSESQTPNGGWQYYAPQTKWTLDRNSKPSSVSVTLDQAAELLQKHRIQNAQFGWATSYGACRQDILDYNKQRLGIPADDGVPKFMPQQPRRAVAAAAVEHVSNTAAGIRLVVDWLGAGLRPIPQPEAEERAAICDGCPQNQTGDLWQRLDAAAAEGLRRLMAIKGEMAVSTSRDSVLKTCLACDCHLPLKVHAPLKHILEHTSAEVRKKLDPRCWILK